MYSSILLHLHLAIAGTQICLCVVSITTVVPKEHYSLIKLLSKATGLGSSTAGHLHEHSKHPTHILDCSNRLMLTINDMHPHESVTLFTHYESTTHLSNCIWAAIVRCAVSAWRTFMVAYYELGEEHRACSFYRMWQGKPHSVSIFTCMVKSVIKARFCFTCIRHSCKAAALSSCSCLALMQASAKNLKLKGFLGFGHPYPQPG